MQWSKLLLWAGLASAWTIEKSEVAVSGSGNVGERAPVSSFTSPLEIFTGRSLDLAFKVGGANEEVSRVPHQAFLRLSVENDDFTHVDKIIPARLRGINGKVVVPFKQIPSELLNHKLIATLLVSGHGSEPLEQRLFEVIALGDDDEVPSTLRSGGFGRTLQEKPRIVHIFPAPPRHVNPVVALAFIGVIDVLFTVLIKGWTSTVRSPFALPDSPSRLSLLGVLVATELAFVLYFVSWSIFTLLTVLAVLLPALFIVLHRT